MTGRRKNKKQRMHHGKATTGSRVSGNVSGNGTQDRRAEMPTFEEWAQARQEEHVRALSQAQTLAPAPAPDNAAARLVQASMQKIYRLHHGKATTRSRVPGNVSGNGTQDRRAEMPTFEEWAQARSASREDAGGSALSSVQALIPAQALALAQALVPTQTLTLAQVQAQILAPDSTTVRLAQAATQKRYRLMPPRVSDNKINIMIRMDARDRGSIASLLRIMKSFFPNPKSQVSESFNIEPMGRCWAEKGNEEIHQFSIYFCYGKGALTEEEVIQCIGVLLQSLAIPSLTTDPSVPVVQLSELQPRIYIDVIPKDIAVSLLDLQSVLSAFLDHIAALALNKTGRSINEEAELLPMRVPLATKAGYCLFAKPQTPPVLSNLTSPASPCIGSPTGASSATMPS